KVVERLRNKPNDLGVDALICITDQPMGGSEKEGEVTEDLYAWWDVLSKPVMLISMAGFRFKPGENARLQKAIVNNIALCLAGHFAQVNPHSRPPRECLLFRNDDRRLEVVSGQRNLEPRCRQKLKEKIPDDLPAIEALLKLFPLPASVGDKIRANA